MSKVDQKRNWVKLKSVQTLLIIACLANRKSYPFQSQTVLAYQPHSVLNASDFVESETSNAFDLRSPEDLFTDTPDDLL